MREVDWPGASTPFTTWVWSRRRPLNLSSLPSHPRQTAEPNWHPLHSAKSWHFSPFPLIPRALGLLSSILTFDN
ncbi:hypothetical protein BX600DRAFT_468051 [Xylariales sp. PMI_506]|nr:hypothetical protein BX600DRAFT_468051 [Xylariales sp. PMI_506]